MRELPLAALGVGILCVAFVCGDLGAQERITQASASVPPEVQAEVGRAYVSKGPLGVVSRELYAPYPKPNVSSVISCDYVGANGLRRFERLTYQVFDDVYQDPEVRYSDDNGKTWGVRKQLTYEDGPEYSEDARETPEFLAKNKCWFYYNIVSTQSGGVVFPVSLNTTHTEEDGTSSIFDGVRCFIGQWNPGREDFDWTVSEPVTASKKVTGYLEKPRLAELQNGDFLLDMRGTNADIPDAAGRHWYSLSKDGGRTWTRPADWGYDADGAPDGRQFYSPATMAKILRHAKTGKLHWFGNISRGPTAGNSRR